MSFYTSFVSFANASLNRGAAWATALTNWTKRKEITINGLAKVADITDDFTSSGATSHTSSPSTVGGWLANDYLRNLVNGSTDVMDFNVIGDTSNDSISYDLTSVSDTAWVLDFDINFATIVQGAGHGVVWIGLSDLDSATGQNTTQNFIGVDLQPWTNWFGCDTDGAVLPTTGDESVSGALVVNTDYYFRITRVDATHYKVVRYSDSDRTEVTGVSNGTCTSTTDTLRYIVVRNIIVSSGTGSATGTIDNVKFWDGISVVENIPSQQTATNTYDMSSDPWTRNDATQPIVSGGVTTFALKNDNTNDAAVIDLGAGNVSDEKWTLDFDLKVTEATASKVFMFGLSTGLETEDSATSQDFIGMRIDVSPSTVFGCIDTDGAAPFNATPEENEAVVLPIGTQYYIRIVRLSTTAYKVERFFDSDRTILDYRSNGVCASTSQALRYIKYMNRITSVADDDEIVMDNLKFYNNITEVNPTTLTDYPVPIKIIGDADLQRKTTEGREDDFSSATGWNKTGTLMDVNTTTQQLEGTFDRSTTNHLEYYDVLGTTVSDTKWTAHLEVTTNVTSYSTGNDCGTFFCLSSVTGTTSGSEETGDHMGTHIHMESSTLSKIKGTNINGGTLNSATFGGEVIPPIGERTYYIEWIRNGDVFIQKLWADRSHTVLLEEISGTTASVASLRYLRIQNDTVAVSTWDGVATFTLDNFRFWDGITNPVNQEVATFEEIFDGSASSHVSNGVDLEGWITNDFNVTLYNGTSDRLDFDLSAVTSNINGAVYDLETILGVGGRADEEFCARFEYHVVASIGSNNNAFYIGFSDTDESVSSLTGTQSFIGTRSSDQSSNQDIQASVVNSGTLEANFTDQAQITGGWVDGTDYWLEIRKYKDKVVCSHYTDSSYSILDVASTNTTKHIGSPLRYFKITNNDGATGGTHSGYIKNLSFWNGTPTPNAEGRKIVFTDNAFDEDAVEYASEMTSYDPINGDWTGYVKIPSLATGADTTIQMYYDYTPSATPSYVPEVITTSEAVFGASGTKTLEDFTDDGWSLVSGGTLTVVDAVTNNRLNWSASSSTSQAESVRISLGTVSDTAWVLRYHYHVLVQDGVGSDIRMFCGLTDANTGLSSTVQDFLGTIIKSGSGTDSMALAETEGGDLYGTSTDTTITAGAPTAGDDFYIQISRDSPTLLRGTLYADANYTVITETQTHAIASTLGGLGYLVVVGDDENSGGTGDLSGWIDDIQFWNGVPLVPNREEATWNSNYKAVHHLQGNSTDSTVYGNDGTDTAVTHEQQNNNVGAVFDGTTSYITVGSDTSVDNLWTGGGSISATINPKSDGETDAGVILNKWAGWELRTNGESAGYMSLAFYRDFATTDGVWTTDVVVPINEISKIEVIYNEDSVSNDPIIIINGIKYTVGNGLTETTTPSGAVSTDAAASMIIGGDGAGAQTFDGYIGDTKVSDVSRPSSEGITSYNAEKSDSDITTIGIEKTQ